MTNGAEASRARGLSTDLEREIVSRIVATARPARIVLFGSAATGTMGQESDVDLLVLQDNGANPREETVRIRTALSGLGLAFDVVVMPLARYDETKDVIGGIAYPAHKYGRVLYEAR
ncbi:MAG TPA: nucleotidyltransferase domain-containing protein [Candidatus Bipolaricaulis sp.]|nr:nucleotidyltransferase domain-containing protein [Candidatus Bipolaricaulis sp.]HPD07556.1 nucleotidyltransferase domain-containing protein [Candidatus Bipolaricaulis sp.]HRS17827.1 nucleotidyltransferase domain-containing protein [Thermoanaerobaculaceae bacterium]HRU10815.1 nucleotidyltransferase domain-containing protein [Thermoanaerobaculia bacterium]